MIEKVQREVEKMEEFWRSIMERGVIFGMGIAVSFMKEVEKE